MVRNLMALVIAGVFSAQISVAAGGAQDGAQPPQETTIEGCLQGTANEGEFILVDDEKSTYQVQAAEGVELAPHVNHRVALTGTVEKTDASLVIKAKGLKMMSASCSQ